MRHRQGLQLPQDIRQLGPLLGLHLDAAQRQLCQGSCLLMRPLCGGVQQPGELPLAPRLGDCRHQPCAATDCSEQAL